MSSSSTSPLYEKASADLRVARFAISKLGQTFEDFQSHAFSIVTLNEQRKNLQGYFGQVEQTLSGRVNELEVKEREVASAKTRLENFEKEVELWKERVEAGERDVEERVRAVEMREKDVKERCEVMELEEGRVLEEREKEVDKRENEVEAKEKEVEKSLQEKREELEEWEKEVKERDIEVEKKEKEVEQTLQEREKELERRENEVGEKQKEVESTLKEREEMVDRREKEVEERENEVEEKKNKVEKTLKEREERVEGREKVLEEKEKELDKREKEADEVVEGKKKGIEEKKKRVVERKKLVKEREKKVDEKEKMVKERHKAVEEREQQLDKKAQAIEAKGKIFEKKRKRLEKKEEEHIVNFGAKKREIEEKENALKHREKKVTEAVELREKEFSKLEQELRETFESQKALYLKEKEVKEALELRERDVSEGENNSMELREIQGNEPSREIETKDEVMGLTMQADDGFGYVNNLFKNMDASGVKLFMIEHVNKHDFVMYAKVLNALRMAPDPAKLVLNVCLRYFDEMLDNNRNLRNKESCILLLELLTQLAPCISHDVLNEAIDFASVWESKTPLDKTPLDAFGFFSFLLAFKLGNFYNFDQLISISGAFFSGNDIYRPHQTLNLCCSLGLLHKIPEFINNLIKEQKRLLAVKYIYFFKQENSYNPVSLLEEHVAFAESRAAVKRKTGGFNGENSALCIELDCLEGVLKCVVDFKLGAKFPVQPLRLRINQLLYQKKQRSSAKLLKKKKSGQQNAGSAKHTSEVSESSSCASAAVSFQGTSVNSQGEFGCTRKRNTSTSASSAPPECQEKRPRLQQVQPAVFPGGDAPDNCHV